VTVASGTLPNEYARLPKPRGARVSYVDIEKTFGSVRALHSTNLDIKPGEFFAVLGPSGSGKSTLLGIAAGYIAPTRGELRLDDQNIVGEPPYRRNIGMVFQNYSLFPHMTVADNISFPLKMRRFPKLETAVRVRRMLDIVQMSGFEDRKPSQLSGGQQQRVALARAAIYDPRLLLMDEPLGALDKNLREAVQDELKSFQRRLGTTVIYVTHDQQEAAAMADRIAILRSGSVVQIDTPRQLYERPVNMFVASFFGEINVISVARPLGCGHSTHAGGSKRPSAEPGRVVCVRPESVLMGDVPDDLENRHEGEVTEVLYSAGTVRYRVRLQHDAMLSVRRLQQQPCRHYEVGDRVVVGWRTSETRLIPEG
jgi:putative spermidine/putrescine transport system ATP-binding protein